MLTSLLIYLPLGAIAGILSGLLGVGGGLVIVPMVSYTLLLQGVDTPNSHVVALATSLATIMFTSVSSFMAHHKKKAVIWSIFLQITPGILLGTFAGAWLAPMLPVHYLKIGFVAFLFFACSQMFLDSKPKPSREIPGLAGNSAAGSIIGLVSSFVGIGGGSLSVPYMAWCNVPIHKAIGTSAAIGFPIAVAGAIGYLLSGMGVPNRPEHCIGFIYLPALIGISLVSVFMAPYGAKLSHSLPVKKLKRYFALLLLLIGLQMSYQVVTTYFL